MKTTRITIESNERMIVHSASSLVHTWCSNCQADVSMATGEQSAKVAGIGVREVFRRVESGTIHFVETQDGQVLVCLSSLLGTSKD